MIQQESNRNLDVEASERNDSDDFDYLENLAYIKVNDIPADPDVKIRVNLQRQNHVCFVYFSKSFLFIKSDRRKGFLKIIGKQSSKR